MVILNWSYSKYLVGHIESVIWFSLHFMHKRAQVDYDIFRFLTFAFCFTDKLISSTPKPRSLYQTSELSLTLPKHIDFSCMNWSTVTDAGARITSPKSSVSVTVPQGAVPVGNSVNLYVAVLSHETYQPRLDDNQTTLTPVVQCGNMMKCQDLAKPVVLSLPHIGGVNSSQKMSLLFCPDLDSADQEWEPVCLNERIDSEGVFMQVDNTMCHLVTSHLGAYVVVANVNDLNQISGTLTSSSSGVSTFSSQQPLLDWVQLCTSCVRTYVSLPSNLFWTFVNWHFLANWIYLTKGFEKSIENSWNRLRYSAFNNISIKIAVKTFSTFNQICF